MKCPHCEEELGLNNICINPICSHFGTTINFSEKININNVEHNNKETSTFNFNNNYNSNENYNLKNNNYYTENNYNDYSNINKTADKYYNPHNNSNNNGISKEEFAAFIGNNADFYLKQSNKMNSGRKFLSWNWPCFFLNTYWLLYRKLYVPAAILIFLNLALSEVLPSKMNIFLMLVIRIIITLFANSIYLNNCERKIKAIRKNISNYTKTQYINRLRSKGGVTLAAPLVLLFVYIIIGIISAAMWFSVVSTPHEITSPLYNF